MENNLMRDTTRYFKAKEDVENKLCQRIAHNNLSIESKLLIYEILYKSERLVNFILYQYIPAGKVRNSKYNNQDKVFEKQLLKYNEKALKSYLIKYYEYVETNDKAKRKKTKKIKPYQIQKIFKEIKSFLREN